MKSGREPARERDVCRVARSATATVAGRAAASPPDEGEARRIKRSTWDRSNATITPRDRGFPLPRKEVIQPHLPVRLPCYDFVPITGPTFDGCLLTVGPPASSVADFRDVTGGVYKAREHIHRRVLTGGY